jgi:hypothetical protein
MSGHDGEAFSGEGVVFEPDRSGKDGVAQEEATAFARGRNLSEERVLADHTRDESLREALCSATHFIFWLLVGCVVLGIVVFTWHLLTPVSFHFLEPSSFDRLQSILFAAVLSSAITKHFDKAVAR